MSGKLDMSLEDLIKKQRTKPKPAGKGKVKPVQQKQQGKGGIAQQAKGGAKAKGAALQQQKNGVQLKAKGGIAKPGAGVRPGAGKVWQISKHAVCTSSRPPAQVQPQRAYVEQSHQLIGTLLLSSAVHTATTATRHGRCQERRSRCSRGATPRCRTSSRCRTSPYGPSWRRVRTSLQAWRSSSDDGCTPRPIHGRPHDAHEPHADATANAAAADDGPANDAARNTSTSCSYSCSSTGQVVK